MDVTVKGTIKVIGQTQTFESGFSKRQLVVVTEEQYPQEIPVDFLKDKATVLDKYKVGEVVEIGCNLLGNEYNGKYYLNLTGWKINIDKSIIPPAPPEPINDDDQDGLPF